MCISIIFSVSREAVPSSSFLLVLNIASFFFFPVEKKRNYARKGGPVLCFFYHLGMNSISPGPRFTEPTRENKDALIRNIRREKVSAVVNELYGCLWVGVYVFIKPQR